MESKIDYRSIDGLSGKEEAMALATLDAAEKQDHDDEPTGKWSQDGEDRIEIITDYY